MGVSKFEKKKPWRQHWDTLLRNISLVWWPEDDNLWKNKALMTEQKNDSEQLDIG